MENPLNNQVGGTHYKKYAIQPIEYIQKNHLDFCQGSIVKYVTRFRDKNGAEDLKNIKHYADILLAQEYPDECDIKDLIKTYTPQFSTEYDSTLLVLIRGTQIEEFKLLSDVIIDRGQSTSEVYKLVGITYYEDLEVLSLSILHSLTSCNNKSEAIEAITKEFKECSNYAILTFRKQPEC